MNLWCFGLKIREHRKSNRDYCIHGNVVLSGGVNLAAGENKWKDPCLPKAATGKVWVANVPNFGR